MSKNLITSDTEHKILNTFKYYRQGSSVPSDGNCGLHAICRALVEGVLMTKRKIKPDSLMVNIFCMFDLQKLPNYWWSDEELAVIANYFGYDMYIYNETDRTGIVFGKGIRPPLVLYSVENNSHWIPGKKTVIPSSCVPKNFTVVENISEVLSIKQIKIKIKGHLLMMSLNLDEEHVESYSEKRNRCRSVSSGRRVKSSSRRHNGSRSGVRDDGKSLIGRNKVSRNKRRDENRRGRNGSRSSDRVQIARRDGSCAKSKRGRGGREERSHSGGEKINHSGKEKGNHSKRDEESLSGKSYESVLVSCTPPVKDNHSRRTAKRYMSLYSTLKNTMLSKIIKQMCHWNQNKENKYKKLVLFDSDEYRGVDPKDAIFDAIHNTRSTIIQEILHHYLSKKELTLLILEVTEALSPPQPSEPSVVQFKVDKYPQFEPTEAKCPPVMDVNCYSTETIDCGLSTSVDSCSNESTDYYSNVAVVCCPEVAVDSSYVRSDSPCDFIECPFTGPEFTCSDPWFNDNYECPFTRPGYTCSDPWINDNYVTNLFDSCALKRDKNMGVGLFDRVYKKTVKFGVIVRCLVKQKRTEKGPPAVVDTPAMPASVVAAAAVASPIMTAWVVGPPEFALLVIREASAPAMVVTPDMTPPTMVAVEVAAPTKVALPDKDLVTVLVDNNHATVSMKGNLTVASADNNSSVKPKARVRRYFSLKKIWRKKM